MISLSIQQTSYKCERFLLMMFDYECVILQSRQMNRIEKKNMHITFNRYQAILIQIPIILCHFQN